MDNCFTKMFIIYLSKHSISLFSKCWYKSL